MPDLRTVITGLRFQVERTAYNEANQVAGRDIQPPQGTQEQPQVVWFTAIEADIPETVLEWVRGKIGKGA